MAQKNQKKSKKPIKIRRSWPTGLSPVTRVKKSGKVYKRSKKKQQDHKGNLNGD